MIHKHMLWCQWQGCNHRYGKENDDGDVKEHYRGHVRAETGGPRPVRLLSCIWPDCNHRFAQNVTPDDLRAHFRNHLPVRCPMPGCDHIFALDARDDYKRAHMHAHCSRDCVWPGCEYIFVQEPTTDDIATHMQSHGLAQRVPLGLGPAGPQGLGPQGPDPPGNDAAAVERENNNIPQHLKDAYPGMNFYCPVCLMLVSGKNASACRVSQQSSSPRQGNYAQTNVTQRHRGGNCNVQGHTNWLILTAKQLKGRKDTAAKARKRKKAAPKSGDRTYKPPGDEEPGGDGGDSTEHLDPPVPPRPRRTGRKRPADGGVGDGAGPSSKKQKK
jgi:hypothetical protein